MKADSVLVRVPTTAPWCWYMLNHEHSDCRTHFPENKEPHGQSKAQVWLTAATIESVANIAFQKKNLSEKMRLALLVSILASCFFDQQALHDFRTEIERSKSSHFQLFSKHCKKTTHHTKWPCLKTQRTREDAILKRQGTFWILIFQGKVWIVTAGAIGGIANIAFQNKKQEFSI